MAKLKGKIKMLNERQAKIVEQLNAVTVNCRTDMHEPGITAIVTGYELDNAMGADPNNNCGEFTVGLVAFDDKITWFNLADLIALARQAK